MNRSFGLILALVGAVGLGACAGIAKSDAASGEQDLLSPTERLIVGQGVAYPADVTLNAKLATLKASQAERRAAAWQIAKRVIEPVKIDGTRTLPRFQTWYAKEEVLPVFDAALKSMQHADIVAGGAPTDAQIAAAFSWEADRASGTPAGAADKLASLRAQLDANGDAQLGGPDKVLMSPEVLAHLYKNYDAVIGCIRSFPAADDAPPSDTNFASCVGTEFPVGSVIIKMRWVPETIALDAWDTSAAGITAALTTGNWGTAPRTAAPNAQSIYTMTQPSGLHSRLAAMHIMSKELRDWAWITLFWSDSPNTDFGADRPADLGASPATTELVPAFSNYKMCTSVAFDETDDGSSLANSDPSLAAAIGASRAFGAQRSWCSNPYLEEGEHNAQTNCIGCHQHAGTDLETTAILEGPTAFPDGSRAQARQNFPADYTFITSAGLGLANMMQGKVQQFNPDPPPARKPPGEQSSH